MAQMRHYFVYASQRIQGRFGIWNQVLTASHRPDEIYFIYIQRIKVSLWLQFQAVDFLFYIEGKFFSMFLVAWINLTAHCTLNKTKIVLLTTLQNIILAYAK